MVSFKSTGADSGLTAQLSDQQGLVGWMIRIQEGTHWWHTNQKHQLSYQLHTHTLISCLTATTPVTDYITQMFQCTKCIAISFSAPEGVPSWCKRLTFFPWFTLAS